MVDVSAKALSSNLRQLMAHYGHNQKALGRKSGVGQTTVSNLCNPERGHSPKMATVDAIAEVYGLKGWQLLVPDQPLDVLLSQSLDRVVMSYVQISSDGRQYIEHVAERETTYRAKLLTHDSSPTDRTGS